MKRITILLLTIIFLSAPFVFGGGSSQSGTAKGTNLSLVLWDKDTIPFCEEIHTNFAKINPGVTITIDQIPGDTYINVISTRLAANNAPDVFKFFGGNIIDMAKEGYWGDLSSEAFASRLSQGFKESASYNGKLYAYPMNCSGNGIFYNKKVFADAGVGIPGTYAEFLTVCEAIRAKGIAPIVVGAKDGWPLQHMMSAYAVSFNTLTFPNFPYDQRDGKITFAASKWPLMFQKIQELYDKGYIMAGVLGMTHEQADEAVATGRVGMYMNGSWTIAEMLRINPNADIGAFILPNDEGKQGMSAFIDKAIGYSPKGANVGLAKALVSFYAEPESVRIFLNGTQTLPCVIDVQPDSLPAASVEYANLISKFPVFPFFENLSIPPSVGQVYMDCMQGIFSGQKNIIGNAIADMDKTYQLDKGTIVWP